LATKIRLKRIGSKHNPHFRIVVADSRTQRDGRTVEELGHYSPSSDPPDITVNAERALHWLHVGAQPTDTVRSLLKQTGVMAQFHGTPQPEEAEAPAATSEASGPTDDEAAEDETQDDSEEADPAEAGP